MVPRRGGLMLETLERRQLMAGDMDLLCTDPAAGAGGTGGVVSQSQGATSSLTPSSLTTTTTPEGEAAPDLQQFAEDLAAAGVVFYGADWCPACTVQKELFSDGKDNLPFIEVTNPDRSLNAIGQAEDVTEFPTWDFPNGTRLVGLQSLETLSTESGVPIPTSDQPTFEPIGDLTVRVGSPLHVPIDAYDPGDGPLTVSVSVADPNLLEAFVLTGNRSIRIDLEGYGDMVFELFEQRAPTASGRVADLADSGFYDGIIFHRVVDDFVIQAGDPTGTGTSGSSLGNFDDDFHPELQHNREGVLSFAKSGDDTNNSQFFVTETPTRFLDFNHSVFGQLVEGFDVREAISETAVNNSSQNRPIDDVTISTIDVFNDTENGVVMLRPTGNGTGTTSVTFTVTDPGGNSFSETISVNVAADTTNSQPFLNPIVTPAETPTNTPATLQLTSIDVEGDAVTYFAQSVSGASTGTVSVDANTGLVTVTPATDFSGNVVVDVGVRPGPGVVGNASGDSDNQRVTFAFSSQAVAVPTGLDLLSVSDTGSSPTDNITNAGSLTFQVAGVTNGASVDLVNTASGVVIGTGVASGSTITITTNNIAALGSGTYTIAARQTAGGETSELSSPITITYDNVIPSSVLASALTQANVGRAYVSDLVSTEEGNGLVYAFTAAPTGATINATTGVINWTPTAAQEGPNDFTLTLTDTAGNVRTETLSVSVAGTPLAEIRLEATDLQGNVITNIAVGEEFLLNFIGVDARLFNQPGVFAAYADILFDPSLIRPVPGAAIEYDDDFQVVPKGTFANGLIDELGAVSSRVVASNERESLIATVRLEAIASGTVNIRSEPADESDSDVLIFGEDNQIPAETVAYGNVTLSIGQSFTLTDDTFSVAEDSGQTTLDVLANDTVASGGGTLSVVSVTQPASGAAVTLSGGEVRFVPTADFNGTSVFTYRVADSNGIQEDASVTVTVTPVNDPPSAQADTFTVAQDSNANTLAVLANDSIDPDTGETLTVTSVGSTASGGTVTIASGGQSVVFTPAPGFIGTDSFSYTVGDGTSTATTTVTVTVESSDDPPTAVADVFSVAEDSSETTFDVLANDTRDAENQAFVLTSVGVPSNGGSARISADGTEFFYTPATDFAGTETVTYVIRDSGGGISTGVVTFTVTPVNDVPPITDNAVTINRGANTEFSVFRLSDLPANVDAGETLTIQSASSTTTGGGTTRIDAATGTLFYTPSSADFVGTDTVTYTISDGTASSTGTLTITVADFAERSVFLNTLQPSLGALTGIMLRGTNLLGEAVEAQATAVGGQLAFTNVLPGSYTVDVPAIPFLQNATEPRQISLESGASDGDATIDLDVGGLRAEFISIRDWLGNAPRKSLLVAVSPGERSLLAAPTAATDTIENPVVELDQAGNNLTIRGTSTDQTTQVSRNVEATMSTLGNGLVQLRGETDGIRLYRVSVEDADVTFVPSATTATSTTPATVATIQAVDPAETETAGTRTAEGETVQADEASSGSLALGNTVAEGESILAASVTVADVLIPDAGPIAQPTSVAAISLEEGDLWVADSGAGQGQSPATITDASAIDQAMQSVAQELTLVSPTGEQLPEEQAVAPELLDQVITTQF